MKLVLYGVANFAFSLIDVASERDSFKGKSISLELGKHVFSCLFANKTLWNQKNPTLLWNEHPHRHVTSVVDSCKGLQISLSVTTLSSLNLSSQKMWLCVFLNFSWTNFTPPPTHFFSSLFWLVLFSALIWLDYKTMMVVTCQKQFKHANMMVATFCPIYF